MQYLYALERQKEAFAYIAKEHAAAHFDPDLNSEEVQDKELLKELKNQATHGFDQELNSSDVDKNISPEVQDAISDGIKLYNEQLEEAEKLGMQQLKEETERILRGYFKLLLLPVTWSGIVADEWNKKIGEDKKPGSGYRNLVSNPIIKAIGENREINSYISKNKVNWDTSIVLDWYKQIVRKDDQYKDYVLSSDLSPEDHVEFVNHLFKKVIFKNEIIDDYMEHNDLGWSENRGILKSMIVKTIKTYNESSKTIGLINLSPNWEEDKNFFQKLFKETIKENDSLEEVIASKSKNWDAERIAAVDKIIMKMAITEFTAFPSIPVKVTINEYIEICKSYSTPKSKQYVNGILDVLSNEMTEKGLIKKSGRGLLDNK